MPEVTREAMINVLRREVRAREDAMPPPHRRNTKPAKEYLRDLDALHAALRELEAGGWRPIDWNAPPKGEALLYFPEVDKGGRNHLHQMWRVGYAGATPRRPTHWQPVSRPSPPGTSDGGGDAS